MQQPFRAMPRPAERHPLLGHLPDWLGVSRAHAVLDTLQGYAAECGPLTRIPLGPVTMVLVADPDLAHELLTTEEANIKGWPYTLTRVVLDNVLLLNGQPWATHRKAYRGALRAADMRDAAERVLRREVPRLAREGSVDLSHSVSDLAADICCQFIASADFPRSLEPARERVQYELAAVGIDLQCQPWAYLSPARWRELRASVGAMREFFLMCVRARPAGAPPRDDILQGFRALQRSGDFADDEEALRDGLVNFFFTAHDVLTASTMWCLYLIAQHPDVQRELRAALRQDPQSPTLHEVVRESLRLYPGYPLFSRRTRKAIALGGYRIPPRTDLIVSPRIIHRLEHLWPDPEAFRPERWRGRTERPPGPQPRDGFMPFGGGYRSCIAASVAYPLVLQIVARVVSEVELSALPDHDPEPSYWGSIFPARGLPVTLRPARADAAPRARA